MSDKGSRSGGHNHPRYRFSHSVLRALCVLCALCGTFHDYSLVFAQDAPATHPVVLSARAVDYSATLKKGHGSHEGAQPQTALVPLADAVLTVVAESPMGTKAWPGGRTSHEVSTDQDGRFELDLGELPLGSQVMFLASGTGSPGTEASAPAKFFARPWEVADAAPPEELRFYEIATEARGLGLGVLQIATIQSEEVTPDDKFIRVRQRITLYNVGFEVWVGDPSREDPVSYYIPVPEGFEVLALDAPGTEDDAGSVDGTQPGGPGLVDLGHGGRGIPFRQPLFPTIWGQDEGYVFLTVLSRPYKDGEEVDLGMHPEYPVLEYSLSAEEPGLAFVPPADGSAFSDMGLNQAMGFTQKVTRTWAAEQIPAHTDIQVRLRVGKPPIAAKTVAVLAIIVVVISGAMLLGRALSRRAGAAASPAGVRLTADARERKLAELERQRTEGRITSVEYTARVAALGASAARSVPAAADRVALAAELDRIIARADGVSDFAQVHADIRTLARALREVLRKS